VGDIVFLKAELKYVTVRTAEREYLLEESLARLEQEFLGRFVRIHRNCLVAKDAIRGFERAGDVDGEGHWLVVLRDVAEKLAVSRRQQQIVREFGRML
jgi:two-component system response regulator AlgR